jgi:TonB family protein
MNRFREFVAGLFWWVGVIVIWPTSLIATESPAKADFGDAVLRDWVQPDYPEAARKAKLEGEVRVEFVVGVDGLVSGAQVVESTDERFNTAALAAVQRWGFEPATEEGKPAASGVGVQIAFKLAQLKQKRVPILPPEADRRPELMPHGLKRIPARPQAAPDPDYPDELLEQKLPGEVRMEFTVDEEGNVRAPRVLWASHPAFVEKALRATEKTRFEPARQGPLAKSTTVQYPVSFESIGVKRAEVLAANHLAITSEAAPDVLPQPLVFFAPVYPRSRLLAGEAGSAEVEFTIDENGYPSGVMMTGTSAPEFGAALNAAAEAWFFRPAQAGGARVPVKLRATYEFSPPTAGAVARLTESLRPEGSGVGPATGLDQGLKPLWRGFPVYPAALKPEQATGEAEIEFVIDRDGRARLPRVVTAAREEFGWAAATAIEQWVFERPMRGGEPVDVRVRISVGFTPPER